MTLWSSFISMSKSTIPFLYTIITVASLCGLIISLSTHISLMGNGFFAQQLIQESFWGCGPFSFWSKPYCIFSAEHCFTCYISSDRYKKTPICLAAFFMLTDDFWSLTWNCVQVSPIFSTWTSWAVCQSFSQSSIVAWRELCCVLCAPSELSATVLSRPSHLQNKIVWLVLSAKQVKG